MKTKILSCLAALTILFHGGSIVVADTENFESFESIEQSILSEQDYTSLNFDSIFNMTEEESEKEDFFIRLSVLPLFYKGIKLLVPVINRNKPVVFEESEIDNDNKTVLFDDLRKVNSNLSSTDLKRLIDASYGSTEEYVELSTGKLIGYGFLESNQYLLNYDFFEDFVSKEDFDKLRISHANGVYNAFPDNTFDYYDKERDGVVTLSEFLDVYKKSVPHGYWPVIFNLPGKQTNVTLPTLKEEILDQKLDQKFFLCFSGKAKDTEMKAFILKRVKPTNDLTDLFTGEVFLASDSYYSAENFGKIGVKNFNSGTHYFLYYPNERFSVSEKIKYFSMIQEYGKHFVECETVRDFVDLYQRFPLKYQVDYSYFDFTKSPDVVQPDQSSGIVNQVGNLMAG